MEPDQEEGKKRKPSRAELEARVAEFREKMQGKMKGHVDGDAEEYLFRSMKKRPGSRANR